MRMLLAAILLLLPSGCTRGVDVAVVKAGGVVRIVATRAGLHLGESGPPCIDALSVRRAAATLEQAAEWEIAAAPGVCGATFVYGRVPSGWSGTPAKPLRNGGEYLVEVSGPGFTGGAAFTMRDADGPLTGGS